MTIIAEFNVSVDGFALPETLPAVTGVTLEFQRNVTHSQEWVMPFFIVDGTDDGLTDFKERIGDDQTVEEAMVVNEFDGALLYQVQWSEDIRDMINAIFDRAGTLVEAVAAQEMWHLKARFGQHDSISKLSSYFEKASSNLQLKRIYVERELRQQEYNVTPEQREALITALKRGYYAVPREAKQKEIAAELGISENALSERLRRGTTRLVKSTLWVENESNGF
ncbi:bacterio-opsin activator [halophilic archaeon]|nr:bacterio-opsin activator [halophilic archaeon]